MQLIAASGMLPAAAVSWLRMPTFDGSAHDMMALVYLSVALLGLRLACEALLVPPLRRALKAWAQDGSEARRAAPLVFDQAYTALGMAAQVTWGWVVMLRYEQECTPWRISGCMAGWPDQPVPQAFRVYWLAYASWYLHEMVSTVLGVGCILRREMFVHHVVTLFLMASSYFYGLHRQGLMCTNLFDLSNPLLLAAKAFNHSGIARLQPLKQLLFQAFAATFFVVRVLLPPSTINIPSWRNPGGVPPVGYWSLNSALTFIYLLQLVWFARIVRMAMGGEPGAQQAPRQADAHQARKQAGARAVAPRAAAGPRACSEEGQQEGMLVDAEIIVGPVAAPLATKAGSMAAASDVPSAPDQAPKRTPAGSWAAAVGMKAKAA